MYLQHGILDNAVTWVLHDPSDAIAYQGSEKGSLTSREQLHAYLKDITLKRRIVNPTLPKVSGCDVFMGELLGVYPCKAADLSRTYWEDVTVENCAIRDLEALVTKIRKVKRRDLTKSCLQTGSS